MFWRFNQTHRGTVDAESSISFDSSIIFSKPEKPRYTLAAAYDITQSEDSTDREPCQDPSNSWRCRFKGCLRRQPTTTKSDGIKRGWRKAMIIAAITTATVLSLNLIFTIVVFLKYESNDGVGILYEGNCDVVKRWDTALHLLINVLGTALLAASSFTMQCLSSPTRKEVDAAHKIRHSMEIGLLSVKNLFRMRAWKAIAWTLLCLSTMPLHLLWNSTIFSTGGTNLFSYLVVEKDFLAGANYTLPNGSLNDTITRLYDAYLVGNLSELAPEKCLQDYTEVNLLTTRRNLIIVVQPPSSKQTNMSTYGYDGRYWDGSSVLGIDIDVSPGQKWPENLHWTDNSTATNIAVAGKVGATAIGNFTLETCWSEETEQSRCKLQFTTYVLYVVIACHLIKLVCIAFTTRCLWNLNEPILATVGDAVASFLDRRDETTHGWCLLQLHEVHAWEEIEVVRDRLYDRKPRTRLYSATSPWRWWYTVGFCMVYVVVGFIMFRKTLTLSQLKVSEAMKMSFGAVDARLILGLDGQSGLKLIRDVVVANSFQLALSATYFAYNSLYTAQCAALEWASYAQGKRKGLRVTWPQGQQRSTYWLQLPYRYSIPLTILLMVMHFLVSQSIFLARLQYFDSNGELTDQSFTDVGYSPRATLTTCCVGTVLILAQVVNALRPLDNHIPIHGNSSAVISAACHVDDDLPDQSDDGIVKPSEQIKESISAVPITWGATRQPTESLSFWSESDAYVPGHCSFSAEVVELPVRDKRYL